MRTWLYRIATNVCLDMLRRPQQRALPIGLGLSPAMDSISSAMLARHTSARTVCDRSAQWGGDDPAELTESRESVRLALATALRHLPPRQVAVLILRDVLRWSAADVAQLLGNDRPPSTARCGGLAPRWPIPTPVLVVRACRTPPSGLGSRGTEAFERSDVESLAALLREDVVLGADRRPAVRGG